MKFRLLLAAAATVAFSLALPAASLGTAPNNQSATYDFALEEPNIAMANNGDTIALTGEGTFSVHPKSASGGGEFTHTPANSTPIHGTWTVNRLVAFQPYGCGVFFGTPIPPNLCGGRLALDVTFNTPIGPIPGKVTVYCVIGSPPPSAEEGVRVVVPGIANFNKQVSGMNFYFKH